MTEQDSVYRYPESIRPLSSIAGAGLRVGLDVDWFGLLNRQLSPPLISRAWSCWVGRRGSALALERLRELITDFCLVGKLMPRQEQELTHILQAVEQGQQ